jgi:hypothetical protein
MRPIMVLLITSVNEDGKEQFDTYEMDSLINVSRMLTVWKPKRGYRFVHADVSSGWSLI